MGGLRPIETGAPEARDMREQREHEALAYDPFRDDETDVTGLADRFVTTRRTHPCSLCQQDFPAGSRARAKTERNNEERKVMTFYFCPPCCEAMAASWTDYGRALIERETIAQRSARERVG